MEEKHLQIDEQRIVQPFLILKTEFNAVQLLLYIISMMGYMESLYSPLLILQHIHSLQIQLILWIQCLIHPTLDHLMILIHLMFMTPGFINLLIVTYGLFSLILIFLFLLVTVFLSILFSSFFLLFISLSQLLLS